ncbi:carbonic anhydrase [Xylaria flabelliformis]|nr:carbonic anhydrase [Xylaria flabelliformis]
MAFSLAQEFLKRNETYVEKEHKRSPLFSEMTFSPKKMIFSCFDSRADPRNILGLTPADGAIVVRNASGTPARNLNDIIAMDKFTSLTEVIVIKHTDCGATHMTEEGIRAHIKKHSPNIDSEILNNFEMETTHDIVDRTRKDVELIKNCPLIRKELRDNTSGLLFDITTGKLTKVI